VIISSATADFPSRSHCFAGRVSGRARRMEIRIEFNNDDKLQAENKYIYETFQRFRFQTVIELNVQASSSASLRFFAEFSLISY